MAATGIAAVALTAAAYLPPVEERSGVKVEIGSFPQSINRDAKNPFAWPLGVTNVKAGAPRSFPVTLENTTDKPVEGTLEIWMNDDWTVAGPQGPLTLAAKEKRTLSFTGTAKPSALDALYPVHARFTPKGVDAEEAPHPIAIFMFQNPNAPRAVRTVKPPVLAKGSYRLDRGFVRTSAVEVRGKQYALPESGAAGGWGGCISKGRVSTKDGSKQGFTTHPPYSKGAGFIWSDFPMTLPADDKIVLKGSVMMRSNWGDTGAPPSDGVENKVIVIEGEKKTEVFAKVVTEPLTWHAFTADLTPWAGKKIALRLWTGPGPKMNTCCDGGGWGDLVLEIGNVPQPPSEGNWAALERAAIASARAARTAGDESGAANRWRLEAPDGTVYGAALAPGERGLIDGVLAFTDGTRDIAYRGFTAEVDTGDANAAPEAKAAIRAEGGTLRIAWSIPGHPRQADGFPRIAHLAIGPASVKPFRVYAGFGNVIEGPKDFLLGAGGFGLCTRHVGADYANGLSVVQATDVPPDSLVCDGEKRLFALQAHHDATYTLVPSSKGAFEAARRFRAVAGYRKSPGHDRVGARMCLDQWGGDYALAAKDLAKAAKYGLGDSVFVKHAWQRWGYDYRLPEIYPPMGSLANFRAMREACRAGGILFVPHDNYTDVYPDAANYSYDLVVFNLDGTPQKAWFNPGRHALSYRWAPHAFHPWALRNAKLLKGGCDPDGVFIDVFTAHAPFDYLDRKGNFHTKMETAASWAKGFDTYRQGYARPDAVCVSEAGQDHLIGTSDAGQSDHFSAVKWFGNSGKFADADRTPWHDIVSHGYYVLFAGGLGGRYQEEAWHKGGDRALHGYGSDDYLSNTIIGGRNPMCDGPFSRDAVKTFWLQHDACAELGRSEFLDLRYEGNVHCQHAFFSDGGEVWINRQTNRVWQIAQGIVLPSYGYYARTRTTESGVVVKDGIRAAFAKSGETWFCDARKPSLRSSYAAETRILGATAIRPNAVRLRAQWKTLVPVKKYVAFVHICEQGGPHEGIVFQSNLPITPKMFGTVGTYEAPIEVAVPESVPAGEYTVRYGAYKPGVGNRLALGGAANDGADRICGGRIIVKKDGGRITEVTWKDEKIANASVARDALLGVNRAGKSVEFGGIRTDGSFRLTLKDWTLVPLPGSGPFSAEIDLGAFGRSAERVAAVETIEAESGAAVPVWRQEGAKVFLSVDALAFGYRLRFR